ncbi:MAG: type IV toxin-antitoxin system AbiEi family antitoxin [Candidatus Eisenbacteria bacterium]|uniref:Type IV toxin-antitoxin system AbiEi family antitoxin n=1 Tax=Eiseniibacteriota bacterium TaxID=2212470 RepID=A0A956NFY7_UNCEI|nr:type IV toxin-antitoxin system AbiEi family antitoxin [Candidatus Eisenbacteria bacterium]MCB9466467.1 type IV toxin-antitoxin system AbiEi family antitoxin [Candidatus Eisenbacteria bacterium]
MESAASYIEDLQIRGRLVFTTDDVVQALGKSVPAVRAQLRRLKDKGQVADPLRGFHVVVPPRYRALGCLPAEQFVPQLMAHLGEPYYVTLLSAAAYHGAAHQKPQMFQVMVPKARRGIECGGVRVDFVARRDMEDTPVVERNTPAGVIRVASPAATALELVGYPDRSGYIDNIATVLSELSETIDRDGLRAEARRAPIAWVQRLGYLLALIGQNEHADDLEVVLAERNLFVVPLAPWAKMEGAPRDSRWKVAVNADVEPDV